LLQHLSWVLGIEPRLPYLCRRNRARPVFEASANKPHRIGRPGETDGQLYSQQRMKPMANFILNSARSPENRLTTPVSMPFTSVHF
jgi:hypothetical protein